MFSEALIGRQIAALLIWAATYAANKAQKKEKISLQHTLIVPHYSIMQKLVGLGKETEMYNKKEEKDPRKTQWSEIYDI